jgi:hypothetical protein
MRRSYAAAIIAVSGALAACSLLVKLDDTQCNVDGDCDARGGPFVGSVCVNQVCVVPVAEGGADTGANDAGDGGEGGIWACLSAPNEIPNPTEHVAVTVTAFDALQNVTTSPVSDLIPVTYSAVSGASIAACPILQPTCPSPVANATANDAGVATMSLPDSFSGFFKLSASGYLPSATYPGNLLAGAATESIPTAMLAIAELNELSAVLGVPVYSDVDSGVGSAFFLAYDCFDHHAAGVTFTLASDAGGPNTVQWYSINTVPSTNATATDSLGAGGVVNVPVGSLRVTATIAATGQVLGTVNPIVTAGSTTLSFVRVRTH